MERLPRYLDAAFDRALQQALICDQHGGIRHELDEGFATPVVSAQELVLACRDVYHQQQHSFDTAIRGVAKLLQNNAGVAQVKALETTFETPNTELERYQQADRLRHNPVFGDSLTSGHGLQGVGIGLSAGASAMIGVLAGADVVFDFEDKAEVHGRTWVGGSLKGGLSISGGLELSFWVQKPTSGSIVGWLIDLYVPTEYAILLFVRFMYIKQRATGATDFTFSGVSLQFPLGIGFPLRSKKEHDPGVAAVFAAKQTAWDKAKRATLSVLNAATQVNTIAVAEVATLDLTLTNTVGSAVSLSAGAVLTLNLPNYFTAANISAMVIDYAGWSFSNDGATLTLTLQNNWTWNDQANIAFSITNVTSSNQPTVNSQSTNGLVSLKLTDPSFDTPLVKTTDFDLVWSNSAANLTWQANITAGFTLTGAASGTLTAYAQPGSEIVQLTTATDSSGATWVLGYVYNYNTYVSPVVPQVYAVWWKDNTFQVINKTVFAGLPVVPDGTTMVSTAYYGGVSTESSIAITVAFGDS